MIRRTDLERAVPETSKPIEVAGLNAPVRIYRDVYGIPHAQATTMEDAFFAQGFFTAQDRLWHMDYDRHRAYGRWAELAGPIGLEQDRFMRRMRLEASARADYALVNSEARAMLDAYAAGVNAFEEKSEQLPVEYRLLETTPEPWQPWDGLAVFKVRHILMGTFEGKAWRHKLLGQLGPRRTARLHPGYQPGHLQILPPGAEFIGEATGALEELERGAALADRLKEMEQGSNNWSLSGQLTESGKPLLAGDPHRGLDTPNVYYQNHVACDAFDVVGNSFAGVPGFPHFGHNQWVAWCVTHTSADYQDLYIERFNDADASLYQRQDDWYNADVRDEVIKVRGGGDVHLRTWATHHGPVVGGDPMSGYGLALRYTATPIFYRDQGDPWTDILPAMLEAQNVHQLADSMNGWVDPVNNFVMADVDGNIGYQCRGEIPRRPDDAPAPLPVPGWDGQHEWQGSIPFNELPRYINPPEGYIVTANNRPVADDYPYYISMDFAPGYRAMRVAERIRTMPNPSANDMGRIHSERVSLPAQAYVAALQAVPMPADPAVAVALARLQAWSGAMDADAVEPTIYSAARDVLQWRILKHNVGENLAALSWHPVDRGRGGFVNRFRILMNDAIAAGDPSLLPSGETWPSALAASLEEAVAILGNRLGPDLDTWRWNKLHRAKPQHPLAMANPELASLLNPPEIPTGGDGDTPWAGSYSPADFATVGGLSVFRYAYDLGNWENSLWAVPLGASGHPASNHYADQSDMWRRVQMTKMRYDWEGIEANAKTTQTLQTG
jgi:penicillin amidase